VLIKDVATVATSNKSDNVRAAYDWIQKRCRTLVGSSVQPVVPGDLERESFLFQRESCTKIFDAGNEDFRKASIDDFNSGSRWEPLILAKPSCRNSPSTISRDDITDAKAELLGFTKSLWIRAARARGRFVATMDIESFYLVEV